MIALDLERTLEVEARKRQATSLPGVYGGKPLVESFPQAVETGKSRDKAGDLFGVSGRYVAKETCRSEGKRNDILQIIAKSEPIHSAEQAAK